MRLHAGLLSYNVSVTLEELWREVGHVLREERDRRGWTWSQVAAKVDIDMKTVQAIERGKPKRVDMLELHAKAFDMSIVDVLSAVLKASEARPTPEAATLLRCFEQLQTEDRQVVLASVQRMFQQQDARIRLERLVEKLQASSAPAPDRPPTKPRSKPATRAAREPKSPPSSP